VVPLLSRTGEGHITKIDMDFFRSVEGSMTSEDGQAFMLHEKRPAGGDLLLGFPHDQIQTIVENADVQAAHGKDAEEELGLLRCRSC